jgi:hypothetical protein
VPGQRANRSASDFSCNRRRFAVDGNANIFVKLLTKIRGLANARGRHSTGRQINYDGVFFCGRESNRKRIRSKEALGSAKWMNERRCIRKYKADESRPCDQLCIVADHEDVAAIHNADAGHAGFAGLRDHNINSEHSRNLTRPLCSIDERKCVPVSDNMWCSSGVDFSSAERADHGVQMIQPL